MQVSQREDNESKINKGYLANNYPYVTNNRIGEKRRERG